MTRTLTDHLRGRYAADVALSRRRIDAQLGRVAEIPRRIDAERLELILEIDADESPEADAVRRLLELDRHHLRRELLLLGRHLTPLSDRIDDRTYLPEDPSELEAAFAEALTQLP